MMAEHTKWSDYKQQRPMTPEAAAAYERAGHAHAIGRRVRELREQRSMSQAELARRIGASQSMVARLESGSTESRLDTLERVCRALDLDLVVDFRPREAAAAEG